MKFKLLHKILFFDKWISITYRNYGAALFLSCYARAKSKPTRMCNMLDEFMLDLMKAFYTIIDYTLKLFD